MFDRSFLPQADFEFVIVADTHYMLDLGTQAVEFESRRQQTARAEYALRQIASLNPEFVIHLGDLVQEFPETAGFSQALDEALQQLKACGLTPYHVAGNHDVGDKPDPTMPTDWVTLKSLREYHARFGQSWYSWDQGSCHFVVINSQILNTSWPEATQQRQWLEATLKANARRRLFLFLHLAPFLCHPQEPALGHYDNIAPPDRDWLLQLVGQYGVELIFSAHSHFAFFNRIRETRHYGAASTSFTRPGFSELFSSGPPSEQGRNDVSKLGFYFIRVTDAATRVHFLRTGGLINPPEMKDEATTLITNLTADLPDSPLGVTITHPLGQTTDVPLAWPSTIRQPVRNDYPLLSCLEAGIRHIRVPATDLADPLQQERLAHLRDEGCRLTATWLTADDGNTLVEQADQYGVLIDGVEWQMAGRLYPDAQSLVQIQRCQRDLNLPVSLTPVIPREKVPGKQHLRTRIGYHLPELPQLNQHLADAEVTLDRVLCLIAGDDSPWDVVKKAKHLTPLSHIQHLDWLVPFTTQNEQAQINQAAEALFAVAQLPKSRLFFSPFLDLDRTMDVTYGLLDRACNPRAAFQGLRALNTILYTNLAPWQPVEVPPLPDCLGFGLKNETAMLWLFLPRFGQGEQATLNLADLQSVTSTYRHQRLFNLVQGTVQPVSHPITLSKNEPMLLRFS